MAMKDVLFGLVSYNGVEFTEIIESSLQSTPVSNSQDTATKYVNVTFTFDFLLNLENDLTRIDNIKEKLSERGKIFTYEGKAYGSTGTYIDNAGNVSQSVEDVNFGPRPQVLEMRVIGQQKAARIKWSVTVATSHCPEFDDEGLLEFWCTSQLKINRQGYQTLIRRGKIEIASNDGGSYSIEEQLSENFVPYINYLEGVDSMDGFQLEHEFTFSPDDKSCDFVLSYEEIESENPYPNGVVEIDADHSMGSSLMGNDPFRKGFKTWTNTYSCSITLRPKTPKLRAWAIFTALVAERLNDGIDVLVGGVKNGQAILKAKVPIILDLTVQESVFTNRCSFTLTWMSHVDSIDDIFEKSGMFKPTSTNWGEWTSDIRLLAQNASGSHPLTSLGNTQIVISQCNQTPSSSLPDTTKGDIAEYGVGLFGTTCPPAESSWVDYQNKFYVVTRAGRKAHRRYRASGEITRGSYRDVEENREQFNTPAQINEQIDEDSYILQDLGNDALKIRMKGFAVRLGYPTNPPDILSIGGRSAKIIDDKNFVTNQVPVSYGKCPVYVTTWDITYEILGYPSGNLETSRESSGESGDYQ